MWRGAVLWTLVRVGLWAIGLIPPGLGVAPTSTINVAPFVVALIIGTTAALAHVDARMMRETLFYALLGVPGWLPGAAAAVTAVVLEMTLELLL